MANVKISDLTAVSALDGSEVIELVQAGTNKKVTAAQIAALGNNSGALIGAANVFQKNQSVAPVVLASAAQIAVDASLSNNFKLTLTANGKLMNPSRLTDGMVLNFRVKQDGTGNRDLTCDTLYKIAGGAVFPKAANAVALMSCYYDDADKVLYCGISAGFA